ncbi:MAG: GGDEF domain-containing protein [Patescibacteria group bacterium]
MSAEDAMKMYDDSLGGDVLDEAIQTQLRSDPKAQGVVETKEMVKRRLEESSAQVRDLLQTVDDLKKEKQELSEKVGIDGLTGLKLYHNEETKIALDKVFEIAKRSAIPATVAMFDLDEFKKVNDTYGHEVGDKVLRCFSTAIAESARDADIFLSLGKKDEAEGAKNVDQALAEAGQEKHEGFRYGGEEFMAIYLGSDPKLISEKVIPRIFIKFRENLKAVFKDEPDKVALLQNTFSCGLSGVSFSEDKSARNSYEEAVKVADKKLYEVKNGEGLPFSRNGVAYENQVADSNSDALPVKTGASPMQELVEALSTEKQ